MLTRAWDSFRAGVIAIDTHPYPENMLFITSFIIAACGYPDGELINTLNVLRYCWTGRAFG
ncbi:hypothetical protein ANO14919_085820 [Xylariales sp. No.14919]|nr:hypothetical protein ANO14919_085820 [Xylariales sp. No.14919]